MNHPDGCTCGWGWGHKGPAGKPKGPWPVGIPPLRSYTDPNARCPVCHADVFYYCNQFGSSVFFDQLGPPWPKHPCTTQDRLPLPRRHAQLSAAPSAFAANLIPVTDVFLHDITPDLYRVTYNCNKESAPPRLYMPKRSAAGNVQRAVIAFLRAEECGKYALEYLGVDSRTYTLTVYASQKDAERVAAATNRRGVRRTRPSGPKKPVTHRSPTRPTLNPVMADAFERAKRKDKS